MALTAAGQRRLLISLAEIGVPVTLAGLKALHADLDGADVGRGVARLAMTGAAVMTRQDGTLRAVITEAGMRILFPRATCQDCGMQDPPPDRTCTMGRDHRVGREAGCPCCGRPVLACFWRPCSAMGDPCTAIRPPGG